MCRKTGENGGKKEREDLHGRVSAKGGKTYKRNSFAKNIETIYIRRDWREKGSSRVLLNIVDYRQQIDENLGLFEEKKKKTDRAC